MKSRLKMALTALVVIACFTDWPVSSNALPSGATKGLVKGCSRSEKAEEELAKHLKPAPIVINQMRKASDRKNNASGSQYVENCPNCNGNGTVRGTNGYDYVCRECNGNGTVLVEQ